MKISQVDRARFEVVYKDISEGSEPARRFYILVAVSTLIAGFGLISNSTAVVIGAMLVAPLMTPIFGISLALLRGEPGLLGRALRAEIAGVVAAVVMSFILGSLLGDFEATPEMLARTRPNLFDLFVAVLAGFAGAYALVDEKISPALPGVAIATAIVPPLANSGLCFSLGEISGGIGSFLLFFANFLSILIVASATFLLTGMAKRYTDPQTKRNMAKKFGLPIVAFVLVAGFLGHSLAMMYEERKFTKVIQETLIEATAHIQATYLGKVRHYEENGTMFVAADVHSPLVLTPRQVATIQKALSEKIGMPTDLTMHCVLSNNVAAEGAVGGVLTPKLDGTFVKTSDNKSLLEITTAEQIIREYLDGDPALGLIRVAPINHNHRKIMLAHVYGIREVTAQEIQQLEERIRKATGVDNIELVFSSFRKNLRDDQGLVRYGWIMGSEATPQALSIISKARADITAAFDHDRAYELVDLNATTLDGKFHFLLEIVGPKAFPADRVKALESRLAAAYGKPVKLYAWTRLEAVNGADGPISLRDLQSSFAERQKERLPEELPMLLEGASR